MESLLMLLIGKYFFRFPERLSDPRHLAAAESAWRGDTEKANPSDEECTP